MENGGVNHNTETGINTPEVVFDTQLPTPELTHTTPEPESLRSENQAEQNLPAFTPPTAPVNLAPEASNETEIASSPIAPTGTIEEQNPEIAVDGEKMEKEWVAKTEKVIETTDHDPQREEIEINKLKADYMAKRFNRHLGDRNN